MHFKTEVRLALRYMFFYQEGNDCIPSYKRPFLRTRLICMNIYQDLIQWTLVCLHSYLVGPEPNNAQLVLRFEVKFG